MTLWKMTNDEILMTNQCPNDEWQKRLRDYRNIRRMCLANFHCRSATISTNPAREDFCPVPIRVPCRNFPCVPLILLQASASTMKRFIISHSVPNRAAHFLAALFLCVLVSPAPAAISEAGTNEDFSAVSNSVVKLLQSRDTARFAAELSPAIEDWQSILSTNAAGRTPTRWLASGNPPNTIAKRLSRAPNNSWQGPIRCMWTFPRATSARKSSRPGIWETPTIPASWLKMKRCPLRKSSKSS